MSVPLREQEVLLLKTNVHWTSDVVPLFISSFFISISIFLFGVAKQTGVLWKFIPSIILFFASFYFIKKLVINIFKIYAVTSNKIYIKTGVFTHQIMETPIEKMNDIKISQSFIQRMVGSGNIEIITGNNESESIRNISKVGSFKQTILNQIYSSSENIQ